MENKKRIAWLSGGRLKVLKDGRSGRDSEVLARKKG